LPIIDRQKEMKLEEEAKKFMQQKNNTASKKLEEIIENLRLINNLTEITFKKLKEFNAKNNSNS
tara:strand:+ start:5070 stop:5261 length:192 start_codon:yes stop_codon:yes gene_type:complete